MSDPEDPGGAGDRPDLVTITDEQSAPVDLTRLQRTATHALQRLGVRAELSVALVEPAAIADLKGRYYGERAVTDVLSFPMDGPAGPTLGDVVLCPAFVAKQASALGRPFADEMDQLVVHGILHLTGLDHATPAEEIAMAASERRILERA